MLDIVAAINRASPTFELLGVIDEAADPANAERLRRRGVVVLGGNETLKSIGAKYAIGVGLPGPRRKIDELATASGREAATLVHPTAVLGSDLQLGPGFVAAANAQVTTNVVTGRHVHLNVGATLSHDCRVGDYVTLSPGTHVSGNVLLEDGVYLGVGAVVRQGITIGRGTVVGAGAVVVTDLPPGVTAVGVPARPMDH